MMSAMGKFLLTNMEEQLQAAERIAGVGSWAWAPGSDLIVWSEGLHLITGRDRSLGAPTFENLPDYYTPESWELLKAAIEAAVESGTPYKLELEMIREDGTRCWVATRGEAVLGEDGETQALRGTVLNIDEQKKMERERIRTQQLESLGLLAGGIAHDFNNLLMSVLGNVSMAKSMVGSGRDPESYLLGAESACDRARDLARQLLTFSKGGAPVKSIAYISGLIDETIQFVSSGSQVKCVFERSEDLAPVTIDSGQISQVINSLVINAIQAEPKSGCVSVQASNALLSDSNAHGLKSGDYIRVAVKDDGAGMSSETLCRIYEPYFTTKETGSGLGLATSYSIIKKHGGAIGVVSKLGEGSEIFFYLPAQPNVEEVESHPSRSSLKGEEVILLMDDDAHVLEVAKAMMESLGYRVETAPHGKLAVEKYKNRLRAGRPYDAVVLDLTIPGGMDGRQTLQEIRKMSPRVKAVISTGYSSNRALSDFKKNSFSGMLIKPYSLEELQEVLSELLN